MQEILAKLVATDPEHFKQYENYGIEWMPNDEQVLFTGLIGATPDIGLGACLAWCLSQLPKGTTTGYTASNGRYYCTILDENQREIDHPRPFGPFHGETLAIAVLSAYEWYVRTRE